MSTSMPQKPQTELIIPYISLNKGTTVNEDSNAGCLCSSENG